MSGMQQHAGCHIRAGCNVHNGRSLPAFFYRCCCFFLQAIDWLKATIKASGVSCEVVAQHDPHFLSSLELAVRFGTVRQQPGCLMSAELLCPSLVLGVQSSSRHASACCVLRFSCMCGAVESRGCTA